MNGDRATLAELALDGQRAAAALDELAHGCQTDARARYQAIHIRGTEELVANTRYVCVGNADPLVGHAQAGLRTGRLIQAIDCEWMMSPKRAVLDGIGEHVVHHVMQTLRIESHRERLTGSVKLNVVHVGALLIFSSTFLTQINFPGREARAWRGGHSAALRDRHSGEARRETGLYSGTGPCGSTYPHIRALSHEGRGFAMKALVKSRPEKGLWLADVPEPTIGINDLLIRVLRTGICGTDLHIYDWNAWAQRSVSVPLAIGHEFVGEVVEVGSNVNDFSPGDIVSGEGHVVCGRCRNCMAGRRHLCAHTEGIGVNRTGAFAEYIALPMTNIWRHAPGIDLDVAAIFDPFGNAVHTALSYSVLGEDVLITGAGPIGIMAAAVVLHAGARHVVITDVNQYRLDLARRLGVTRALDVRTETIKDAQAALGMQEGFDVGLEMSGSPSALRDMLANMAHGGRIAMLGIPKDEIAIDWNTVVFNMLTIKGIYGREMYETWYMMTSMLQSGLDISPVITHRFPYADYEEAFAVAEQGNAGKVVLHWADASRGAAVP